MEWKQYFCKHRKVTPHKKVQEFENLSGTRVFYICDNCGKVVREKFMSNEEFYFRYEVGKDERKN